MKRTKERKSQSPYKGFNRQLFQRTVNKILDKSINPPIRGSIVLVIGIALAGLLGINPPIRGSIEKIALE